MDSTEKKEQKGFTLIELLACPATCPAKPGGRRRKRGLSGEARRAKREERRRSSTGFTLIELLVVMAIVIFMFTVALPAFKGWGRGTSMQIAMENLRSTCALARQWAITHRETTYLVFPDDQITDYSGSDKQHAPKALRSYNIFTTSDGYLREWTYLPDGIIFDPGQGPTKNVFSISLVKDIIAFPTSTTQDMFCVAFQPDGSIRLSGFALEVYLTEGWVNANTDNGTVDPHEFKPTGRVLRSLSFYPLTGQFRIREYDNL